MTKAATRIVLPHFQESGKPFVLLFWSRDPDMSASITAGQHRRVWCRASTAPAAWRARAMPTPCWANCSTRLKETGPGQDHRCFRHRRSRLHHHQPCQRHQPFRAFRSSAPLVDLPSGFLAIDLAATLGLPLRPPGDTGAPLDFSNGAKLPGGSGMLGSDPAHPDVVVAANGGSDLIYLPAECQDGRRKNGRRHRQFPPDPGLCQRHFRQRRSGQISRRAVHERCRI